MNEHLLHWLGRIANSVSGLVVNDCDMAGVTGSEAAAVMEQFARIERMAAIGKLKAAARVAETPAWQGGGDRDAAGWFARKSGSSKRDAQRSLDAAKALEDLEATKAAAENGELSESQLREVAEGAGANPEAERDLLASARKDPLGELRDKSLKAKASAGDRAGRHERIRRNRQLRHGTDAEGAFWINYRNTGDVGAAILAALQPIQDRLYREARDRGERETTEAYAADALAEAVCGGAVTAGGPGERRWPPRPHRPRPSRDIKVIVRIDHSALTRGHTVAGETCDIAGVGPVPVSTVKEMMDDAFLAAIVTDGHGVLTAAHLGRAANAFQQTALEFTQPCCQVEGCWRTEFLQTDHRTGWTKTLTTVLDDLDRLCEHHHELKTNHGWQLEPGRGKRRFLSPEDQEERRSDHGHDPPGDAARNGTPDRRERSALDRPSTVRRSP